MIFSELNIRNMKSYGNITQKLRLATDKGQLILLTGENGDGKSTLLEAFEYTLYNTVKSNKNKSKASLSSLPNRMNKNMETSVKFLSENGINVKVKRGISPNILELSENGVIDEKANKDNINQKIINYAGMDINTFKSFISMSINDFKNFIELSNEDKQNLIDKLFNLEIINELNIILKTLVSENKKSIDKYNNDVESIKTSVINIRERIANAKQKEEENYTDEIKSLEESILSNKEEYLNLKNKLEKIKIKIQAYTDQMESDRNELSKIDTSIQIEEKGINLYKKEKCPTCGADFKSSYFATLLDTMIEKRDKLVELKEILLEKINKTKSSISKGREVEREVSNTFNTLNYTIKTAKAKIEQLSNKMKQKVVSTSIEEFEKMLNDFKLSYKDKKAILDDENEMAMYYKELSNIFGENGVKKSIISGLIKPINEYIKRNLAVINLPFSVELDESFSAKITTYNEEIDQDSLSTGENKLINICIMLAYLNLIRAKKTLNILFLDEVFSSVSVRNIDKLLLLLNNFALESKVNVIVVHHALLNQERFDKIITVSKDVFSKFDVTDLSTIKNEILNDE